MANLELMETVNEADTAINAPIDVVDAGMTTGGHGKLMYVVCTLAGAGATLLVQYIGKRIKAAKEAKRMAAEKQAEIVYEDEEE